MEEHNHGHGHSHEDGHIPPLDPPRKKMVMGFRPHIFIGGLVLIVILIILVVSVVSILYIDCCDIIGGGIGLLPLFIEATSRERKRIWTYIISSSPSLDQHLLSDSSW